MLKITATGFGNWEATFIKTTVALATGLDVGVWGYVDRREEADVVLVNIANDSAAAAFSDYTSESDARYPRIIPCTDNPAVAGDSHPLWLRHPVTYPGLVQLLVELQSDLRPRTGVVLAQRTTAEPQTAASAMVDGSSLSSAMQIANPAADKSSERPRAKAAMETCAGELTGVVSDSPPNVNDPGLPIESVSLGNAGEEIASLEPPQPREKRESEAEAPAALAVGEEDDAIRGEDVHSLEHVADQRNELGPLSPRDDADHPAETRERPAIESGDNAARIEGADTIDISRVERFVDAIDKAPNEPDNPKMSPFSGDADTALATQAPDDSHSDDNSRRPNAGASADDFPQETAGPEASRLLQQRDDTEQSPSGPDLEEPVPTVSACGPPAVAALSTSAKHGMRANRYNEQLLARDRPARKFYEILRFLGIVRDAVARGQVTKITHEQFPSVWIFPEQRLYLTPSDTPLQTEMFRTLASEFAIHPIVKGHRWQPSTRLHIAPLWRLLYLAALYGSEGRLKESARYTDRLHLVAEPDFSVVPCVAEHRRIANYMLAETADVATVAAAVGVSIATVIDFSNACDEVSLVERASLPTDDAFADNGTVNQVAGKHKLPGLIRRLQSLFRRSC